MLNYARLQVLKCKETHIRNVLDEARSQLGTVVQKPDAYKALVEKLLLQGLLQLYEDVSNIFVYLFVCLCVCLCVSVCSFIC